MRKLFIAVGCDEADEFVLSQLKEWAENIRKEALGNGQWVHPEDQENALRIYGAFMTVIGYFEE